MTDIPLGSGNIPVGVAVNQAGTRVYVTNSASNTVSVIDTSSNTVIATVPVGTTPYGVAVNPSGTRVYVAYIGSNVVSVIDTNTNSVISKADVGMHSFGVAVNRSGTRVYVTHWDSNFVSVIDTDTNRVIATIPVGSRPHGIVLNPAGTLAYVANRDSNSVSVIDTSTHAVTATIPIPVGKTLQGIGTNPEGTRVYVANFDSNTVSVIDTSTNSVLPDDIPVGTKPVALGQFINRGAIWKWSGSLALKITNLSSDTSGNMKFQSSDDTFTGTLNLYEEGGMANQVVFISDDGLTSISIKSMAYIETDMLKGKTDQSLLIGTGDFSMTLGGITYTGIAYMDAKGTLKKDKAGEVISISLSGKIAGGKDLVFTFSENFKANLTR
jgi:YVTN family beta-propeller protein